MDTERRNHQAYTLRLTRTAESGVWRATLYCAETGQRHHFRDLDQLHAFLVQETAINAPEQPDQPVSQDQPPTV